MAKLLKMGAQGPEVRRLTRLLQDHGFHNHVGDVFDREVRRAVEAFQARNLDSRGRPLVVDGKVGELTWWALERVDGEHPPLPEVATAASEVPSGGSAPGRAALAAALAEMRDGAREIGTNNDGPFVEKYLRGIVPPPANWCAGFVSWCFSQAPGGIPFRYSLGARDIRNQFQREGWLYDPEQQQPQPGDVIFWWRGQPEGWMGHIGLVHHAEHGIVFTVEGNKGGFPAPVRQFDYVLGRIDKLLGFGRVP